MFKKLRLKIARWALAPQYIDLHDLSFVIGSDAKAFFETQQAKQATLIQNAVFEQFKQLSVTGLRNIVALNQSLDDQRKFAIFEMLDDAKSSKPDYLR